MRQTRDLFRNACVAMRATLGWMLFPFLMIAAVGQAFAQAAVPDTPAGKAFAGWLAAFDSTDPAAYRAFVEKNWPSRVNVIDQDRGFRRDTDGLDLRKIDPSSTAIKLVALVQERNSDRFAQLTLTVEDAPPYRITDFAIRAVPRPVDFALPHLTMPELTAATREHLEQQTAADRFSGAVLIAQDGKPQLEQAYGLADRQHKVPNTVRTRFRIGSMNKMFTAVSILQLVQAGKVQLDDPLGKFLTDYPNKDVASKVTIRQLLTHTGGTGDIFGPEFDAHRLELKTIGDYVRLFGSRGLAFEPGSRFQYSNYGYILLGAVIEKASGENYYDYVRKHVYEVAGMSSTGSEPEDVAVPERSIGYTDEAGTLRPNTDTLPYRGSPAGGGYSTVDDLFRFAEALRHDKLLDARYTELATTGKVKMPGGNASYGYGFGDLTVNGTRCFGHNGGAPGMFGDLMICAGGRDVVVLLSNRDPQTVGSNSGYIANRLPQ